MQPYGVPPALYPQNPETIIRSISIEIQANNTTGKFGFPNNNELNGKRIIGISLPHNAGDNLIAPSGRDSVDDACIGASYLSIRRDADNIIYEMPLRFFQETSGDRSVRPVNIKGFNPQTSFINVADTSTYATTESFVIEILYTDI